MTIRVTNESSLIRRAAEMIQERGWCQDTGEGPHGEVCAVNALAYASRESEPHIGWFRASDRVKGVVEVRGPLYGWNDEPGRTKEEVLAAFEAAAQKAEEAGD